MGIRRVGKTSVLSQLEWIASETPELGYLPLFWDFQDAGDPEEPHLTFYDSLLDSEQRWSELGIDISELDPADLFASLTRLRRQIRTISRKVLLLCDKVEESIELQHRDASPSSKLRRTLQSGKEMRGVLASTIHLWTLMGKRVNNSSCSR